ncbi:hypothetical protein COO60DRAFT_945678 [Scenedesmus sp. NREL 46B-D3]|nr:hypothetical protein COO60DRAFT_945678 [Scenedesmus sp. NREL 46B-D3]
MLLLSTLCKTVLLQQVGQLQRCCTELREQLGRLCLALCMTGQKNWELRGWARWQQPRPVKLTVFICSTHVASNGVRVVDQQYGSVIVRGVSGTCTFHVVCLAELSFDVWNTASTRMHACTCRLRTCQQLCHPTPMSAAASYTHDMRLQVAQTMTQQSALAVMDGVSAAALCKCPDVSPSVVCMTTALGKADRTMHTSSSSSSSSYYPFQP